MWINKKWAIFIMVASHKFHVAFMIGCKNVFCRTVDEIGVFLTVVGRNQSAGMVILEELPGGLDSSRYRTVIHTI
jgi:hypothetical protein